MSAALGALLAYPDAGLAGRAEAALAAELPPGAREALAAFADHAKAADPRDLEELYTRTFDMNPACSLEVGWHLHGEQYERGAFLVRMRELLRRLELPEDHELPDHLSHALRVLGRLEGEEGRRFAAESLVPAVAKMREGLTGQDNPYRRLLEAVDAVVQARAAEVCPR